MSVLRHTMASAASWTTRVAAGLTMATFCMPVSAQAPFSASVHRVAQVSAGGDASVPADQITLDRVVAIVNNDLVLESDVDAEERFAAFQPFSVPMPIVRERLINRLIDRALIFQQIALQPSPPVSDSEVKDQLMSLRKAIPKCAAYRCDTEAGWNKFVTDQGFTLDELQEHWKQRIEVLRFIEERFRMGIRILPSEVDAYYTGTMLPAYQAEKAQAPQEATIADRIQEILLQQRVDTLLDDWLIALRAQGTVRILQAGEEAP